MADIPRHLAQVLSAPGRLRRPRIRIRRVIASPFGGQGRPVLLGLAPPRRSGILREPERLLHPRLPSEFSHRLAPLADAFAEIETRAGAARRGKGDFAGAENRSPIRRARGRRVLRPVGSAHGRRWAGISSIWRCRSIRSGPSPRPPHLDWPGNPFAAIAAWPVVWMPALLAPAAIFLSTRPEPGSGFQLQFAPRSRGKMRP